MIDLIIQLWNVECLRIVFEFVDFPKNWLIERDEVTGETILHKIARFRKRVNNEAYIIQIILNKIKWSLKNKTWSIRRRTPTMKFNRHLFLIALRT